MGLGQNSGRTTFVNISKGKCVVSKDGHKEEYGFVEGYLTGIEIVDDEYNKVKYRKALLRLTDGNDSFTLQLRLDSGYGRAFCCLIPNADLSLPLKISPSFKDDRGSMFINQNGQPLKWYFTKDHPHDLPPLKKSKFKDKDVYDNTDQLAFFENMLLAKIKPKLKHEVVTPSVASTNGNGGAKDSDEIGVYDEVNKYTEPVDDLPF